MADAWDQFPDAPSQAGSDPWAQFPDAQSQVLTGSGGPQSSRRYVTQAERMRQARGGVVLNDTTFDPRGLTVVPDIAASSILGIPAQAAGLVTQVGGRLAQNFAPGIDPKAARESVTNALTFYRPSEYTTQQVGQLTKPIAERVTPFIERHPAVATGAEVLGLATEATGVGLVARGGMNSARRALADRAIRRDLTPEQALSKSGPQEQNMGAAAAAPDITNVSDELKRAIVSAGQRGKVNIAAVKRHAEADSLPYPIVLTRGEALDDSRLISLERNSRGNYKDAPKFYDDRDAALGENLRMIRDEVGPDVFTPDMTEHGRALMKAYSDMDESANNQIRAAYQELQKNAGGKFPVGANTILTKARVQLGKKWIKQGSAPQSFEVLNMLEDFAKKPGSMKFDDFEEMRTRLAEISRGGGTDGTAARIIRGIAEEIPLLPGAERLKVLADKARALSKNRFSHIEADPAYKAIVNETIAPDDFVKKFIIGGKRDDIAKMRESIPGFEQQLAVAAVDYLRDQAGLFKQNGKFQSASYDKALRHLQSRGLTSLLDPKTIETLEKLNRVAAITVRQTRGSFVNNSNSWTAAAANLAGNTAESLPLVGPGVGVLRGKAANLAAQKEWQRIIAPGAGIGDQ